MFLDRFGTPDGRARFHPVEYRPPAEVPDAEYPMYLTTGRVMAHYQSGSQTRRVTALHKAAPEPFVEIHPAAARGFGIAANWPARARSRKFWRAAAVRSSTSQSLVTNPMATTIASCCRAC